MFHSDLYTRTRASLLFVSVNLILNSGQSADVFAKQAEDFMKPVVGIGQWDLFVIGACNGIFFLSVG